MKTSNKIFRLTSFAAPFGCAAEWAGCLVVISAACAFHS
ncbi:MAG: hypothetical protein JWP94_3382 [Mucilaginibacter sp.]|jgi:hypothetical protein|nr:hypothetical protein [Mucilaginibacter sp.]